MGPMPYSHQVHQRDRPVLTTFDKINLAQCAARRAEAVNHNAWHRSFEERQEAFSREYGTARLWRYHRMTFTHLSDGRLLHYTQC